MHKISSVKSEKKRGGCEHFSHGADIEIRGFGETLEEAFEMGALSLVAVISNPEKILPQSEVCIECQESDRELLFFDWINRLIYEMDVRKMIFSKFDVEISKDRLLARVHGDSLISRRYDLAVEVKGATLTELKVDCQAYVGAMNCAMNCAMANRQILTHFTRNVFKEIFPQVQLKLVYDVSHNTCKVEQHTINGKNQRLFVHRKGATRAFGPNHPEIPEKYRTVGQPVFIGGSMGVGSYVLVGTNESERLALSSSCHGAGHSMSRTQATRKWKGREVIDRLHEKGILIRSASDRGVAEEAPEAYKDLHQVVRSAEISGLSRRVAYLTPHVCIKG